MIIRRWAIKILALLYFSYQFDYLSVTALTITLSW
jgi:hypothetical protein